MFVFWILQNRTMYQMNFVKKTMNSVKKQRHSVKRQGLQIRISMRRCCTCRSVQIHLPQGTCTGRWHEDPCRQIRHPGPGRNQWNSMKNDENQWTPMIINEKLYKSVKSKTHFKISENQLTNYETLCKSMKHVSFISGGRP